jgi:Ring finger domain
MLKKREKANPARSDSIIASNIAGVPGGARNVDGMPALVSPVVPVLRDYPRAGGGAVPRVPAAHPAVVRVNDLVGVNAAGGCAVRPIQTGHSTNKRKAALIAVSEGELSPATKSRDTDSMVVDFKILQQEGLQVKAVKAQAALITAKHSAIQNHLQTLMFFQNQPESPLRTKIVKNTEKLIAELTTPDVDEPEEIEAAVEEDKKCAICHETVQKDTPIMNTPCMHSFHFQCLRTWMSTKDTCPICRNPLTTVNPVVLIDE